jgi:hypothetical protein
MIDFIYELSNKSERKRVKYGSCCVHGNPTGYLVCRVGHIKPSITSVQFTARYI